MSETTDPAAHTAEHAKALRLAKLFDLRTFIGALFLVFGVVVTIEGLVAGQEEIDKAAGIRLSLWTGLVMLALGAFFVVWMLVRPPELVTRTDDLAQAPDARGH